jgi:hypothetical protein
MVHLQKLHDRYQKNGLLVFVISMEPDPTKARQWNADLGVTYPVLNGHGSDMGERYAYG